MEVRVGECNHCGMCCKHTNVIEISDEQRKEYEANEMNGGYCYHYDRVTERCKIHGDEKPELCKVYPRWPGDVPPECSYEFVELTIGDEQRKSNGDRSI